MIKCYGNREIEKRSCTKSNILLIKEKKEIKLEFKNQINSRKI